MQVQYRRELYKLLPVIPEAVCAELGSAEGYFSADMASWGIKKLYVVDMWESCSYFPGDAGSPQEWHDKNYKAAVERLSKFGEVVEILRGPTVRMAQMVPDRSLDLVYIDACHSYECVKDDITAWWPKLKAGGIMAFHDYEAKQYGVKKAVLEFARSMYPGLMFENYGAYPIPEDKSEDAGAYIVKR